MKKSISLKQTFLVIPVLALALTGCATAPDGHLESAGCDTGTNYGGAAVGAVAGGAVGSLVGAGTGNVAAIAAGAAAGGYAGSKSRIGCRY